MVKKLKIPLSLQDLILLTQGHIKCSLSQPNPIWLFHHRDGNDLIFIFNPFLSRQGQKRPCHFLSFLTIFLKPCDHKIIYSGFSVTSYPWIYRWKHNYLREKWRIEHLRQLRIIFIGVCRSYPHREKFPHIEPSICARLYLVCFFGGK